MNIINKNIEYIHALCQKYNVSHLAVFGSVLTEQFSNDSDIDLVVDFNNMQIEDYADNYFALKYSLETLFKREIDLLEDKAIKNPYLRSSIDSSKKILYAS